MMFLTEDELGRLDLLEAESDPTCTPGYVVPGWIVGHPVSREVVRGAALDHGEVDDTSFLGGRVITATVRLDTDDGLTQDLIDALTPYMNPLRRPRLHWSLPGSNEAVRSALVRGVDAPIPIDGPRFPTVVTTWKAPRGVLESVAENEQIISPGTDVETGRTYDLTFDRTYPPGSPIGTRQLENQGNIEANWQGTIFGPCTNPVIDINGTEMRFDQNGGLVLTAGTSLVIDTREQTVLLNGDPNESRYSVMNFPAWQWRSLRLFPGQNSVRFSSQVATEGTVRLRWRSTWI